MSFQVSFGTQPTEELPVGETNEQKLARLHAEQVELINKQREIQDELIATRQKMAEEAEEARRAAVEAAKMAELEKQQQKILDKQREIEETVAEIERLSPKSWEAAHPYQKSGIISAFHSYNRGDNGFFNADDMGLGKTFQAIAAIELYFAKNPSKNVLWVSKSSIVETGGTKREIEKWSDLTVVELLGRTPKTQREFTVKMVDENFKNVVLITNYETMRTTESLQDSSFGMVVMDEVHKLKGGANPSGPTGLWKALRDYIWKESPASNEIVKDYICNVDFILMLSGTPMVNRVAELWAYLHIFDPVKFNSLKDFERAFNAYVEYGGKVNTDKILDMCLRDRMVRRTRDEVGLEIPELNIETREIEFTDKQQEIYNQMKERFFIWLDEQEQDALTATAIVAQLIRLRQIAVWPVFTQEKKDEFGNVTEIVEINVPESAKVDEAMDIIEEANDQVVVFCNFNSVFDEIKRRCNNLGLRCEFITGKTKSSMSEYEIGFQNGEIDVLCINSSMGEGLNLQKNPERWKGGASVGIHLDMWWNPARDEQCNARIHRQGSKKPVFIYKIHAPKSIDDYVRAMSEEKGELFDGIMSSSKIRPAYEWKKELREIL